MTTSAELAEKDCVPCKGGTPPLAGDALASLEQALGNGWKVVDGHHLEKEYRLPDFVQALSLVNRLGELAEAQSHHPDIHLAWGLVRVTIWTHTIDGLTESDFVWAAKADRLAAS